MEDGKRKNFEPLFHELIAQIQKQISEGQQQLNTYHQRY